uniref:Predicted protein n=1 Tax=Hordeum vulgare subsp. vulgare TaxID=112509 RepID=F2EEC3_HORVV|nr:predicted protein [Hordeum vulgare subsp. vulgare]
MATASAKPSSCRTQPLETSAKHSWPSSSSDAKTSSQSRRSPARRVLTTTRMAWFHRRIFWSSTSHSILNTSSMATGSAAPSWCATASARASRRAVT